MIRRIGYELGQMIEHFTFAIYESWMDQDQRSRRMVTLFVFIMGIVAVNEVLSHLAR